MVNEHYGEDCDSEEATGNYAEAARQLGLHATNLHRLIRNLNIKDDVKK